MSTHEIREKVAKDTIARSAEIVASVPGASLDSNWIADQLPPLPAPATPAPPCKVQVLNADTFIVARDIMKQNPEAQGKTTVLNLASDQWRAGGWTHSLAKTQVSFRTVQQEAQVF